MMKKASRRHTFIAVLGITVLAFLILMSFAGAKQLVDTSSSGVDSLKNVYEKDIKTQDEALRINPHNSTVWIDKGLALEDLNRFSEAVQAFDKAIVINPQDSFAWSSKGNALTYLNKSEAIAAYDKAIEINPNSLTARNDKGIALEALGQHDEAQKAWDKSKPKNSDVFWRNKAMHLYNSGKFAEANKVFD